MKNEDRIRLQQRNVVAMRHRLVHAYYDINLDILWRTLQDDLPPLVQMLRAILDEA